MSSHHSDDPPDPSPPDEKPLPPRSARPTPRSAPAVAFLQVTQDSAEVTEVPPPKPVNRLPIVIAAVVAVVVLGGIWFSRLASSGDVGTFDASTPDSLGSKGLFQAAVGGQSSPDAVSAATPPSEAVSRFAHAIIQASMDSLVAVAPSLTTEQRAFWEKEFARAGFIEAPVELGAQNVSGDSAQVDFVIALKILDKDTKQESNTRLSQHATMVRQGTTWQIAAIR